MKFKRAEKIEVSFSEISNILRDRNTSQQISYNDENEVVATEISCPVCNWKPSQSAEWYCDNCSTKFNIFNTSGFCPKCGHKSLTAQCAKCSNETAIRRWFKTTISPMKELKKQERKLEKQVKSLLNKERFPESSISIISLLKDLNKTKIIFYFMCSYIFIAYSLYFFEIRLAPTKQALTEQIGIILILFFLLWCRNYIKKYRIRKNYWGTNEYEAREAINFILENSKTIDFTDGEGKSKKIIDIKDLKEELAPNAIPAGVTE